MKLKINSCDGVYNNSLDVRFTKACDNRCEFCIERNGIDSLGETNVPELIKSTKTSGKTDILILGGEPLLYPVKILEYIKGIRDYAKNIYLTTSLPNVITSGAGLEAFNEIISLLDGINISVHHYSNFRNNSVLRSTKPYDRITFMEYMLKNNKDFQNKARICCNLAKGYIDSKDEIDNFLTHMKSIGVQHVKLNELQNVDPDLYVSFEDVYNVKMPSPFSHGCQTDESKLFNLDMKVTIKRCCFCNKDSKIAKATISDLVKCVCKAVNPNLTPTNFKVLYENGKIEGCWLQAH